MKHDETEGPRSQVLTDVLTQNDVRVFPFEDAWTFGIGDGYYSFPKTKQEAVAQARSLAGQIGADRLAVLATTGKVEEWVTCPRESFGDLNVKTH